MRNYLIRHKYLISAKPFEIKKATIHTYWDSKEGLNCPLCSSQLQHEFNNGGRKIITLKGPIWVVTNYYSCINLECEMHEEFPAAYHYTMQLKRFSLEVWAKVIQHHFKHHFNYSIIAELILDNWVVSISRNTVRSICEFLKWQGSNTRTKKS